MQRARIRDRAPRLADGGRRGGNVFNIDAWRRSERHRAGAANANGRAEPFGDYRVAANRHRDHHTNANRDGHHHILAGHDWRTAAE